MDDGSPELGVGFAIDAGNSFGILEQISRAMDSTEAKVIKDAASIERATGGMLNLGGATASVSAFGSAATRELQTAAQEAAKVEKSGEAMIRSLDRQASTFGKTASEIRSMKAETAALAAEQAGLGELAGRIRSAEQAIYDAEFAAMRRAAAAAEDLAQTKAQAAALAEREAAALASAAAAAERDAREHAALAAMVRASHDAQLADAAAAELMRERTDPLYATVKRLNAEIAESTRLYHQGATAPAEYARQQEVLAARLRATTEQHDAMAMAGGRNANSLRMIAIQMPDVVQGLLAGQKPFTIFIQQGGQIAQIAMMAEGGLKGMALQMGRLAVMAAPFLAVVGTAAGGAYVAFKRFQDTVKDDGELTRYRDSLGLTRKEMEQLSYGVEKVGGTIKGLGPVTVTFGDEMAGIWKTISDQATAGGTWGSVKSGAGAAFDWILEAWGKVSAGITAGIRGTFTAIGTIWGALPSLIGNVFVNAANLAIGAMNALVRAGVSQINGFISGVNAVLPAGMKMGQITAPQINPIKGFEGAKDLGKRLGAGYTDAYATARKEDAAFWKQANANARKRAEDQMKAEADAIKANRIPKTTKPKIDHNALNAEALEAQIKNLYKLADAYGASGAAALVAEAREKAESEAIKKRGDIEEYVNRQIRLAIAQRVADGAKATASLREQADIQERVNGMVAAGLVPAERAQDIMQDQLALLPLVAAQTAALHENDKRGYEAATDAIKNMAAEQDRLNKSKRDAQYLAAMSAGADQLAMLEKELELVGKTDNIRVHSLAVLKATQEVKRMGLTGEDAQKYIDQQVEIADKTQNLANSQNAYNEALSFTADKWDQIARNVQDAANGMSAAFGASGKAIGDIAAIYATYRANEEDLKKLRKANADSSATQAVKDRRDALLQLKASGQQIQMYGDMVGAAKGFFNEKSKIYKALQTAEMAYRAVQLAMSIAAMFQDTAETGTHVANSAARATANATEGVAAQAKLPFPANIAAMAATAAAVIAMGVSLLGGRGGGGHSVAPLSSEDLQKAAGTGTVLGSPNDKSASIAHSLDLVAKNTDGVMQYNSQMLTSLRSIDASIGAMAATVAKQINVAGSLYDTTKLNLGASGNAGFLGLFSSSTTRSLYDAGITLAATTVGDIVSRGISGSTYQIVEQVKKSSGFLGIGGGTKTTYQTTTGGLPSDVAASIQSVIGALENGIVTAAGAIGIDGAKAMLDNFTVSIGQLSFNGLDAQGIEDQLNAVFSSVGDQMVASILPGVTKFQKVGEGLFETLERVASTVGAVDAVMQKLGRTSTTLGIDVDMGIASMFDSVSDFTSAANAYFETYYSSAEQTAAKSAQLTKVFGSLNLAMPDTLAAFRALVDAQDLTTAAGQQTYATLLQLAPAFADLKAAMDGAKSAADILSEKQDLQRQMLELQGDTAAIRALDLAKVDPSNRALQQQIYDLQDAQAAAKAAQDLADAWKSVGNSIMDEVKRIRGLTNPGSDSFASLQGQFNAASLSARGGDQDAAKSLPGLSQALLTAASAVATSQQELRRIQAQTAASLEATYNAIAGMTGSSSATTPTAALDKVLDAISTTQSTTPAAANDDMAAEIRALREEIANMRRENTAGLAAVASGVGKTAKILDNVTAESGGDALATRAA